MLSLSKKPCIGSEKFVITLKQNGTWYNLNKHETFVESQMKVRICEARSLSK